MLEEVRDFDFKLARYIIWCAPRNDLFLVFFLRLLYRLTTSMRISESKTSATLRKTIHGVV
jgi:hypothetical protein